MAGRYLAWTGALALLVSMALPLAAATGSAQAQEVDAGEELFRANCVACHGADAEGTGTAPALGGVVDRLGREGVETTIREGRGGMPAFGDRLSEEQIAALAAYLDTLPPDGTADRQHPRPMMRGWPMMWNGPMAGWGLMAMLVLLFSIALLVLVVLGVVWLVRSLGSGQGSSGAPAASGAAREALDLRYARGEIGREEYLQARQDLEGPPG